MCQSPDPSRCTQRQLCERCTVRSVGHTSPERMGWIGVDLDGTLAVSDGWHGLGHIGAPVPAMVARVKTWLAAGEDVRIMTARLAEEQPGYDSPVLITAWCVEHLGRALPVTCRKDQYMIELWDDRAVAVEHNTGEFKRFGRRRAEPVPQA